MHSVRWVSRVERNGASFEAVQAIGAFLRTVMLTMLMKDEKLYVFGNLGRKEKKKKKEKERGEVEGWEGCLSIYCK